MSAIDVHLITFPEKAPISPMGSAGTVRIARFTVYPERVAGII
jgi:hypothetical protein